MSYTAPTDVSPGSFLEKAGSYHFYVISVEEKPTVNGEIKNHIHLNCQVLAGTESSEIRHRINLRLNLPSAKHKDGGDFSNRVIFRMARALGLLPLDIQPGQTVDDPIWVDSIHGQFIADITLEESTTSNGKMYARIDGVKIFHVDDEERIATPKCSIHLALISPDKRLTGTGPAASPGVAEPAPPAPTAPPAVTQPVEPADDFGDV